MIKKLRFHICCCCGEHYADRMITRTTGNVCLVCKKTINKGKVKGYAWKEQRSTGTIMQPVGNK